MGTLHVLSMYQNEVCRRAKPLLPLLEPLTYRSCVVAARFILSLEPAQVNEFSWALYIIGTTVRSFSFCASLSIRLCMLVSGIDRDVSECVNRALPAGAVRAVKRSSMCEWVG